MNTEHVDCEQEKQHGIHVMPGAPGCLPVKPASEVSVGHIGDFVLCSMHNTVIETEHLFSCVM